jgi:HEPN domain-containing protein
MTADDFPSAAVRHLDDAQVLVDARRPDGAVHAAGFAAECALKALLVRALPGLNPKDAGHDLGGMVGKIDAWAAAVTGDRDLARCAVALSSGSALSEGHPNRRYWRSRWSDVDAAAVVAEARHIVDARVIGPWLDRGELLGLA